ncbi:hypothetical protein [Kribbella sp. NPDC051770]
MMARIRPSGLAVRLRWSFFTIASGDSRKAAALPMLIVLAAMV